MTRILLSYLQKIIPGGASEQCQLPLLYRYFYKSLCHWCPQWEIYIPSRSNPANRVEVWKLSDVQDISNNRETNSRNGGKSCTPISSRSSPSPFNPPAKIVDGVPCLSLAFLHSTVNLKHKAGEFYPNLTYHLIVGLQVCLFIFEYLNWFTLCTVSWIVSTLLAPQQL